MAGRARKEDVGKAVSVILFLTTRGVLPALHPGGVEEGELQGFQTKSLEKGSEEEHSEQSKLFQEPRLPKI